MRELWTGDNLDLLGSLDDASAGLVYLDPPFGSSRSYDAVLSSCRLASGEHAVHAFDDRWPLDDAQAGKAIRDIERRSPGLGSLMRHVESVNPGLAGYLAMMAPRLLEGHRVLHDRGSIYVHCDPAASHYLKAALDVVFGPQNFRSEIIWKRTHAHSSSRRYGPVHDVVLFYSRSAGYTWSPGHTAYDESYVSRHFRQSDEHGRYQLITCTAPGDRQGTRAHFEWRGQWPPPGRHWAWQRERMQELEDSGRLVYSKNGVPRLKRYVDDGPGLALQDLWVDIHRLDAHSDERVGYETQKPIALLERIIAASTEPGDLVVDPFCGTGTTMVAAERLGRSWAGGDLSLLATGYALARVRQDAGREPIELHGFPASLAESRRLLAADSATYGVWSAGMLATLVDRRGLTETVVHGRGRLRHPHERAVDLISWIPVARGPVENGSYDADGDRALGLVVDNGRGAAALTRRLADRLPALPVRQVEPSALVAVAARRTGLVDDVVQWAREVA